MRTQQALAGCQGAVKWREFELTEFQLQARVVHLHCWAFADGGEVEASKAKLMKCACLQRVFAGGGEAGAAARAGQDPSPGEESSRAVAVCAHRRPARTQRPGVRERGAGAGCDAGGAARRWRSGAGRAGPIAHAVVVAARARSSRRLDELASYTVRCSQFPGTRLGPGGRRHGRRLDIRGNADDTGPIPGVAAVAAHARPRVVCRVCSVCSSLLASRNCKLLAAILGRINIGGEHVCRARHHAGLCAALRDLFVGEWDHTYV